MKTLEIRENRSQNNGGVSTKLLISQLPFINYKLGDKSKPRYFSFILLLDRQII